MVCVHVYIYVCVEYIPFGLFNICEPPSLFLQFAILNLRYIARLLMIYTDSALPPILSQLLCLSFAYLCPTLSSVNLSVLLPICRVFRPAF